MYILYAAKVYIIFKIPAADTKKAAYAKNGARGFSPQHRQSPQDLHPAIKEFARLLVAEVRNHLVEEVDKLTARPLAFCAH